MSDPYTVLGVPRRASDAELRAAYRRAVQLHHPDHNGGSPESGRRFEEIQEAYAAIRAQRGPGASTPAPDLDARMAAMEAELAAARDARESARRAARAAAATAAAHADGDGDGDDRARRDGPGRASDEELGYVTTEDSFGAIFADAAADVFDDLAARLRGERKRREP